MSPATPQGAPIDRYVVLKYLAEGGMGAIYLGKKLGAGGFEKEVVLKQLLPEFTRQPEFIDLFLREARLSASLDHANIIHTIDLVTAGEEYFIVMEYLDGADLRTLHKRAKRRRRRLSPAAAIYIGRELLSALAYAHNKIGPHGKPLHLIHRDVSPSNILVSRNGEVKLTDFGIAKASTHNSVFYRVKGKVGYMSPEQARSDPLDYRSDLYSLAVCIYETISGERLFVQAGLTTSAEDIYNQPIRPLSRSNPTLPPELDRVMRKALALDRHDRYATAGEFQEALLRCAHRSGLMMSAPELAIHLEQVCGPAERWRNTDARGASAEGEGRGGTELYEPEGTEQIDVSSVEEDEDLVSVVHPGADEIANLFSDAKRRQKRAKTSLTNLSRLQNIELTSMINIAGIAGAEHAGAMPLVDFDDFGDVAPPPIEDSGSDLMFGMEDSSDALPAARVGTGDSSVAAAPRQARDDEELEPESAQIAEAFDDLEERRDSGRLPWILLVLLLLAGIGVAIAIGLSGPKIGESTGESAPPSSSQTR